MSTGEPQRGEEPSRDSLAVLSLFSGIGGLELGLERAGMHTVGQVELDPYCRRVLAKHWPDVPRHDDVRTAADWWSSENRPRVDVICGGFPCQDISVAGRRAGILDGERSSLWAYMADAVRRIRPRYVLVENVPRVLNRGRDGAIPAEIVAADLAAIGYDMRWDCVPASAVGAPHQRDRWFGIAYPHGDALREQPIAEPRSDRAALVDVDGHVGSVAHPARVRCRQGGTRRPAGDGAYWTAVWPQALADADDTGRIEQWRSVADATELATSECSGWWSFEPDVGRVANGIPHRVDRLRALGNAVVPQVAEHIGRLIVAHHESADSPSSVLSLPGVQPRGEQ